MMRTNSVIYVHGLHKTIRGGPAPEPRALDLSQCVPGPPAVCWHNSFAENGEKEKGS